MHGDIGDLRLDDPDVDERRRRPRRARPRRRSPGPRGALHAVDLAVSRPVSTTTRSSRARRRAAQRRRRPGQRADRVRQQLSCSRYAQIEADTTTLQSAAQALSSPTAWQALTATSSNPNAVTVSAGHGNVHRQPHVHRRRARHRGQRSLGQRLQRAPRRAVDVELRDPRSRPAARRSASRRSRPTPRCRSGTHTITVTQASAGAIKAGDTALGASTTIDGTNDTLQLSIDGNPVTLTLAHGTYNADAAGGRGAGRGHDRGRAGRPRRSTRTPARCSSRPPRKAARRRSRSPAATRSARSTCRPTAPRISGTDGKVQVDGGAIQTVTDLDAGQSITLNAPTGTISAVFSGGLRAGSDHRRRTSRPATAASAPSSPTSTPRTPACSRPRCRSAPTSTACSSPRPRPARCTTSTSPAPTSTPAPAGSSRSPTAADAQAHRSVRAPARSR